MKTHQTRSSREKTSHLSVNEVSRDMDKPRCQRWALLVRVRIYDGGINKPKIRFSIPLPLLLCFSIALEAFIYVFSHATATVLSFTSKKGTFGKTISLLSAVSKGFFLTRLSYGLLRHGRGLGIRAIDGDSGVIIYGA